MQLLALGILSMFGYLVFKKSDISYGQNPMRVPESSAKTAIKRNAISAPTKFLIENDYIKDNERVLDYGCGHGDDADTLGFKKYDPATFPKDPGKNYKKIVANFVLNTLEKKKENAVIRDIKKKLAPGGEAFITVRRDIDKHGKTTKGTFQRNVKLAAESIAKKNGFEIYRITKRN